MKEKIFILNALLCLTLTLSAVPAKRGVWRMIPLVDGNEVRAQLQGDEFEHYYVAEDGARYLEDSGTGLFGLVTDAVAGENRRKAALRRSKIRVAQVARVRGVNAQKASFLGTKKGLVILAEFSDNKFRSDHDLALFQGIVNGEDYTADGFRGSVREYFKAQSLGQFDLDFDVVGFCPLKGTCSYYGGNDTSGNDLHAGEMVAEACLWAHAQGVDFSQYDWDGDGYVDQVFVLYAGKGEADGGSSSTIWPHMYSLYNSDYGKELTLDGVKVDTYACSCELQGNGKVAGIGTFCHEFSHCMGLPDLYDTWNTGCFGMGNFDLMDGGNYNGDSRCPAGYSAYEKAVCGWITLKDMTNISEEKKVSEMAPTSVGGTAYVVKNLGHKDEYYVVENRQKIGWDSYLPASGIMIVHVDYDENIWAYNIPNSKGQYYDAQGILRSNDHPRLTIFRAGNSSYMYGASTDLYPYNDNNSLTATTRPAATLYNKNIDGTKYMHIDIKDMEMAADGMASLTFCRAERGNSGDEDPDAPVIPDGALMMYESFNKCLETGGNDGRWTGLIAKKEIESDKYDNEGWTSPGKIYAGYKCVRLGMLSTVGAITTPSFHVNGSAMLSFKAGAWASDKDASKVILSVSDGGTLSKQTFPVEKGQWKTFAATIYATGNVKVTLTADQGRFFLDEVRVVDSSVNGIEEVRAAEAAVDVVAYYSLDGTLLPAPHPGVNLVRFANGKVKKITIRK